jgi:heme-degrading monooxygenase HmoA
MMVTVFRSRLRPEAVEDYLPVARRMSELAAAMPGYVSHKSFAAEDGERLTLVEFDSKETTKGWAAHPEHIKAQRAGRDSFYSEYHISVCEVLYRRDFERPKQR